MTRFCLKMTDEEQQQQHEQARESSSELITPTDNHFLADRKKLIIFAASIVAVVFLIILIVVLVILFSGPSCKTTDKKPQIDLYSVKPIASQNYRALVRFAGYLVLKVEEPDDFDDTKYVELKLNKVHHSVQSGGLALISLQSDCVTIDITVKKDYFSKKFILTSIRYDAKQIDPLGPCLAKFLPPSFSFDEYYRCHGNAYYNCSDNQVATATIGGKRIKQAGLRLIALDLEIDGDRDSIKSGYFDRKPFDC